MKVENIYKIVYLIYQSRFALFLTLKLDILFESLDIDFETNFQEQYKIRVIIRIDRTRKTNNAYLFGNIFLSNNFDWFYFYDAFSFDGVSLAVFFSILFSHVSFSYAAG